jgi:hypothetical protein
LLILAIAAIFKPKALLTAKFLSAPATIGTAAPAYAALLEAFWQVRWFSDWRSPLLIVKPETVLGWQRVVGGPSRAAFAIS